MTGRGETSSRRRWLLGVLLCLSGCAGLFQHQVGSVDEVLRPEWRRADAPLCMTRYRMMAGQVDVGAEIKERAIYGRDSRGLLMGAVQTAASAGVRAAIPVPVPRPFAVAAVHGAQVAPLVSDADPFGVRAVCGPRDVLFQAALAVAAPGDLFGLLSRDARGVFTRTALAAKLTEAAEDPDGCVRGVLVVQSFTRRYPLTQRVCPVYAGLWRRAQDALAADDPGAAEPLLRQALDLRSEARGHTDRGLAPLLVGLGDVVAELGRDGEAVDRYRQALSLDHGAALAVHNRQAQQYLRLGELELARAEIAQAEPLARRLPEADRERRFASRNGADLLRLRGALNEAEAAYQRLLPAGAALAAAEPAVLLGLGQLYVQMGELQQAAPLLKELLGPGRVLRRRERLAAVDVQATAHILDGHPERAQELLRDAAGGGADAEQLAITARLGALLADRGEYAAAEALLGDGLRRAAGPVRGALLGALGQVSAARGDLPRASERLREALRYQSAGPRGSELRAALGAVRLRAGHPEEALPLVREAFLFSETVLRQFSTESRMERYLARVRVEEDLAYSLLLHRRLENDPAVRELALSVALLRKGRTEDAATRGALAVLGRVREPGVRQQLLRLLQLRGAVSQAVVSGAVPAESLLRDVEAHERALAEVGGDLRSLPPPASSIIDEVRRRLPADGALLEVLAFQPLRAGAAAAEEPRYAALLLLPDGRIGAADLGRKSRIDGEVAALRQVLTSRQVSPVAAAQAAYRSLLRPLRTLLGGVRRLIIAPDGALSLLPFAALHDGQAYVADALSISYLTSGRDLLRRREQPRSGFTVVLADPDLRHAPGPTPPAPASALRDGLAALRPLPGTRAEAAALLQQQPATTVVHLGQEATEETLLQAHAPRILHIASHGLFLQDEDEAGAQGRGLLRVGQRQTPVSPPTPGSRAALSRSALVLAGAAVLGGDGTGRDGLATALEVAGMDLRGTQLVVLSACDTGRGDVQRLGQGVYGLRRAFLIAGAQTVVASLWPVSDEATRDLMAAYYRGLWAGHGRAAALREAAQAVRAAHPHPHDWAPFVVIGEEGPLSP